VCRVKGFQHLEVVESLSQGVYARVFSKRHRVLESSEGIRPFKGVKGRHSDVGPQEDKFLEEGWMVRII
jgi:hypothetical protein